ncbi:MAG: DUF4292 domain-containing protein [Leeuwenhoekiella sp.]
MRKAFLLVIAVSFLVGCKAKKNAISRDMDLATVKVIRSHYDTHLDFETLAARVKVRYKDEDRSQSVSLTLRMEKDETIWMSASVLGFSVAKAMITKDRVQYYEKITKSYFDGDFKLLSDLLGTELNFQQVQSLLLAEPLIDLRKGGMAAVTEGTSYVIKPKKNSPLFDLFFKIGAGQFNLQEQKILQPSENRVLTVNYGEFQSFNGGRYAEDIRVLAQQDEERTSIELTLRNVDFNTEVSFPFSIPDGYKAVDL